MGKYYVQSGTVRSVVQAESSRSAALWAVHQVMKQVLPLDDGNADHRDQVAVLDGKVTISEQGFDRDDASEMPTMNVVTEWNQMVVALDRLEQMLHRA